MTTHLAQGRMPRRARLSPLVLGVLLPLAACTGQSLDLDMRGAISQSNFDTSNAALTATASRPRPDDRGIISYPNYQVAIAEDGDTVATLAQRIGVNATSLAQYNGLEPGDALRDGEVVALPGRVAEPSPATGASTTGPIRPATEVDVNAIAGNALDNAAPTQPSAPLPARAQTGLEPVRHQVQAGETAFSIARLYNVSVRSLADWNALDADFTIRTGQFLLIPAAREDARIASTTEPTAPGTGSPTPVPPSASQPLPEEVPPPAAEPVAIPETPALQTASVPAAGARMLMPVSGPIIRDFSAANSDGIDISAAAGSPVRAAERGTVAAIVEDTDRTPMILLQHADNVITVYANVSDISLRRGDSVTQGQTIGTVSPGSPPFLHFQVREGFDSVDPTPYLR